MIRIGIIVLGLLVFIGLLFWKFGPSFSETASNPSGPVELTIWSLREDEPIFRALAEEYKKKNPNFRLKFVHQSTLNYRTRVQTQIAHGQGPDIFMVHNTWVPMFLSTNSISTMPSKVMTINEFSSEFYPVAKDTLTEGSKIYAVPAEFDGLAMFVNEDILKAANVEVPQNWGDFQRAAQAVTVKDNSGRITTAGASVGTTNNVDYWPDILGLLLLQQPGVNINKPDNELAAQVINFYTSFAKDRGTSVWDKSMENSTKAFLDGKLAFYFGPSDRVREFASNPSLKFKTYPVPQLPGGNTSWGSFWGWSVASNSPNQELAWDFIKCISSADSQKLIFKQTAETRTVGDPFSRVDLRQDLLSDVWLGSYLVQAPNAKSWYLSSQTFDQGINDEMIAVFQKAVDRVLDGGDPLSEVRGVSSEIPVILEKYTKPPQAAVN